MLKVALPVVLEKLDGRITEIKSDIHTAESLRVEAQELLAQYERNQRDAAKEAEEIVAVAKQHAEKIKAEAEKNIQQTIDRREKQLEIRLGRMEKEAIQEIRDYAAQLAVQATKQIITEKLKKSDHDNLLKNSLSNVSSHLN